jgi:hypothetical protein
MTVEKQILITDINKLTVAKFEDCLCDQNLSVLVVSGSPSDVDLIECWSNLYAQYLDILGDAETIYLLQLEAEIEQLNFKIVTTEGIISMLRFFHVSLLVDTLKGFGFNTKSLTLGNSSYEHGLNQILGKLAHLKLKLDIKRKELAQITEEEKESTVTRERLITQRMRLSKFMGYAIKPTKTYVPEYVAILKDYLSLLKIKTDGNEQAGKNY